MTDKIELKPCPFCGGKAYFLHGRKNECITCEECGHRFYSLEIGEDAQKELWKQWNRRPIEDELRKDLRYYRNYCAALEQEVKPLRDALTFYAELDGNGIQLYGEMDSKALEFIDGSSFPFGQTARDALKGGEK